MTTAGGVAFNGSGGVDTAAYAYSVLVEYGDSPAYNPNGIPVFNPTALQNLLSASGCSWSFTNEGVVVDGTMWYGGCFTPYYVAPPEAQVWWNANKDQYGGAYYYEPDNELVYYADSCGYQVFSKNHTL